MDIKSLIKNHESTTLECKKAAGGLPNNIWETYSSFANTNGRIILLGVEEIDKELFITGVPAPQDLIKIIWDILNNPQKVSVNILSDWHIYVANYRTNYEAIHNKFKRWFNVKFTKQALIMVRVFAEGVVNI